MVGRKLKLTVTTDGKVGVKSIAKTFASGESICLSVRKLVPSVQEVVTHFAL